MAQHRQTYSGEQLQEIAFPLGGLGTGCVSLSGTGELIDWEIFNRPNKGSLMPYSFMTLSCQQAGQTRQTRVLQSPPRPPFGGRGGGLYRGFGFGVGRENGAGLPHMRDATFVGEFPVARIEFTDASLPVEVALEAYSPFIPLNADDSGLPIAAFRVQVANRTDAPVQVTVAANLFNPIGYSGTGPIDGDHLGGNINEIVDVDGLRGLLMTSDGLDKDAAAYGTMALTTTWENTFIQQAWLRGSWFDAMHDFWDHLSSTGRLPERAYGPSEPGQSDVGTLGLMADLAPGESVAMPLQITWHFPTFEKYWARHGESCEGCEPARWRNYYASQWTDALDVARYYRANETRLYDETMAFHDALIACTMPDSVVDAISSQASILHSPTVLRLEDGTFYGFEGCHCDSGCCEGSCTHVWNYAQTVAFLFPALERSLREADYRYNMRDNGQMCFRLQLPLGAPLWDYHAAADGQLGGILKTYRDWRLCGDDAWLSSLWPRLKQSLAYAWEQWDANRDGVIDGIQHNTYDIEFYGPNTMVGSFYLGALAAAAEMAECLGDSLAADSYRTVLAKGQARLDAELFNGEYYVQRVPEGLTVKYQYGLGCLSDQLIGQWFAHVTGLGYLLSPDHVASAMSAVFRHNWRHDFWDHPNPQRIYALNDEQGLLLCTWPNGGRPQFPFVYSDEVWCGIEYQVASHLIYEGLVDEGLAIVKGLRDRHDGRKRNPWNEFECGSHYARSLASWSVLTALSGYSFDARSGQLGFNPRINQDDWRSIWSLDSGWGIYSQIQQAGAWHAELSVTQGSLALSRLELCLGDAQNVNVSVAGQEIETDCTTAGEILVLAFKQPVTLEAGTPLEIMTH